MSQRVVWVDGLRGAAVVAVVLFHSVLVARIAGLEVGPVLAQTTTWLGAVRMPVLLTISGALLAPAISAGLQDGRTVERAARPLYFYVLWLGLYAAMSSALPSGTPWRVDGLPDLLLQLVAPDTPLWYLFALGVLTVALSALRRVPTPALICGLALVAVANGYLPQSIRWWALGMQLLSFAVFFAIGARLPELIPRLTARRVRLRLAVSAGLFGCLQAVPSQGLSFLLNVPLDVVRGVVAVALSLLLFSALQHVRSIMQPLAFIGRRTLAVYVLHVPLLWLALVSGLLAAVPASPSVLALGVAAGTVGVALLISAAAAEAPIARRLFAYPDRAQRRAAGHAQPPDEPPPAIRAARP